MKITRATFIESCSLALVAAFADPRTILGATTLRDRFGLQQATATRFRPYLNHSFAVLPAGGGSSVRMILTRILERPIRGNVEQFSLIFHAPPGEALADGTHAFEHTALGSFEIFIVRVGAPNNDRVLYQACFSRHLPVV